MLDGRTAVSPLSPRLYSIAQASRVGLLWLSCCPFTDEVGRFCGLPSLPSQLLKKVSDFQ